MASKVANDPWKADLKIRVNGIKLVFSKGASRKTSSKYFVDALYPVCDLFNSDMQETRKTVIYNNEAIALNNLMAPYMYIDNLIKSDLVIIVNATAKHGLYGIMIISDIIPVEYIC